MRSAEWALNVELTCPSGITCIMGPSGSGKSTILAVLAGLTVPDAGRVAIGGDVWLDREKAIDVPVHKRRLAYVFQGLALFPHMTAMHNVMYGMRHVERADRPAKARALLDQRYNVAFQDIRAVAPAALRHRIKRNLSGEVAGVTQDELVQAVLDHVYEE